MSEVGDAEEGALEAAQDRQKEFILNKSLVLCKVQIQTVGDM